MDTWTDTGSGPGWDKMSDDALVQTDQDAHDQLWFNSGWEACRREVLAIAEHQGDQAAVDWASRHPA